MGVPRLAVLLLFAAFVTSCGGEASARATLQDAAKTCATELSGGQAKFHVEGEDEDEPGTWDTRHTADEFISSDEATGVVSVVTPGFNSIMYSDPKAVAASTVVDCMFRKTGAPASLAQKFESSTSVTGFNEDTYNGIKATYGFDGADGGKGVTATFEPAG